MNVKERSNCHEKQFYRAMTLIVLGNGMTTVSILLVPVIGWFCRVRIFSDFFAYIHYYDC